MADSAGPVKRFYDTASVETGAEGFRVLLDLRSVRTPARNIVAVPTEGLADASAGEWNAQAERVDPRSMPLTGLANAAIDRVAPDSEAFARALAAYGESDLLCYRSEGPASLVARQAASWDPILTWARQRYDVGFEVTSGIVHRPQPPQTVERLAAAVAARPPFELAALSPLVTISGSLIIALALAEAAIDLDEAWSAAALDELWQIETWGEDEEALRSLDSRRREFEAAWRFLSLL